MPREIAGATKIQIDKITTAHNNGNVTVSHTVANYSNRMLIVGVGVHQGTVSNVTFDGVALTKIEGISTSFNETAELWAMVAPTVTTANVVVTKSGGDECMVGIWGLYNCYQSLPSITAEAQGSTASSQLSITTTQANDWVLDCICAEAVLSVSGSNHIQDWNQNVSSYQDAAGSHYEQRVAGSYTSTWTLASSQRRAHVAIVVRSIGTIVPRSAATWRNASIDTFTRADSASDLGSTNTSETWTQHYGTWGITGNKAYLVSAGSPTSVASFDSGKGNIHLTATLNVPSSGNMGVAFRVIDGDNFLAARINNGASPLALVSFVSGSLSTLATASPTINASTNYVIKVSVYGSSIKIYVDDVLLITHTLSASNYALFTERVTRVGMRSGTVNATVDNFVCAPADVSVLRTLIS